MKRNTILFVAAALGLAVSSGFSQGTINFANSSSTLVQVNNGSGPVTAAATTTSGIHVELFYQADAAGSTAPAAITATSLGNWEAIPTAVTLFTAGRFNGSSLLTGTDITPAGNVYLDVVAFNGNVTSLAAALGGGSTLVGYSTVWSQGTGDGGSVAAVPIIPPTGAFTGLTLTPLVVPEPSTIVLGGLGAAALLAFRRRNK